MTIGEELEDARKSLRAWATELDMSAEEVIAVTLYVMLKQMMEGKNGRNH